MVEIDLSGKIAIVTGAGEGIGEAVARRFAEAGATVHLWDIDGEAAEKVAGDINAKGEGKAKAHRVDVSDEARVKSLAEEIIAEHKRIDILVNVAGINILRRFEDTTTEQMDRILDVNLKGTYYSCRAVVKQMIEQGGGKILNTSSEAGVFPFDYHTFYSASKYGIIGMSHVMATELGRHNINVNCLCPGMVKTDMWDSIFEGMKLYEDIPDTEKRWEEDVANIPMKRAQSPEDMANAALFLCSDLAENISGQSLLVNGAEVCR